MHLITNRVFQRYSPLNDLTFLHVLLQKKKKNNASLTRLAFEKQNPIFVLLCAVCLVWIQYFYALVSTLKYFTKRKNWCDFCRMVHFMNHLDHNIDWIIEWNATNQLSCAINSKYDLWQWADSLVAVNICAFEAYALRGA